MQMREGERQLRKKQMGVGQFWARDALFAPEVVRVFASVLFDPPNRGAPM